MKRDPDLMRTILVELEGMPTDKPIVKYWVDGYDDATVSEHVRLLSEAGLIDAADYYNGWVPQRLRYEGHDFLEMARNDTIWNNAKATLREKGIGFTIELMQAALMTATKSLLS